MPPALLDVGGLALEVGALGEDAVLASHEAKLRSPGATRSTVPPVSLKPPELSELMLSFSQPVVAK